MSENQAEPDWEMMFAGIRHRYNELRPNSLRRLDFVMHVRNLSAWEAGPLPEKIDDSGVLFPEALPIAFATCLPDCGKAEFIVEGSTQECQRCGRLLYRHVTRDYVIGPRSE